MSRFKDLQNKRILVVEDMELNQYLARHIMESWGCQVDVAENGAVALEKISNADFDIVLMDIQMPVMDGMEATRQIRNISDQHKSSVPIVALTANAVREYEIYIKVGMNDCLAKPFEEASLYNTVLRNIKSEKAGVPMSSPASAPPEPASGNAKMYDLSMVEAISGGDNAFVVKMVQLFLDTVPSTLNELSAAAGGGDWLALSKQAHKLKSTIDSMGITELKQEIRVIENNGKTGVNTDKLQVLTDNVVVVMNKVMQQVKKDFAL